MKYYIPTTSLNFNCILSSESVSPVGFYQARRFGYSRWFAIPQNDQEGAILLYERPFQFKRPESDLEDHPMMIEIETDEEFQKVGDGVYASDHTIYLNSLGDKIILFSEKDRTTVLSLSDSSLETKMVRLFKKRIVVRSFDGEAPDILTAAQIPMNRFEVERDQKINKIKGLLYGYYIGALLSADPKDVRRLNVLREIQSIFSSVISSEHRHPTDVQSTRLMGLFAELKRDEPCFSELVECLGDESKAMEIVVVLRRHGFAVSSFDEERLVRDLSLVADVNPSQKWVADRIDALKRIMVNKRQKLAVGDEEIVADADVLLKISDSVLPDTKENQLFVSWINDVLSQSKFDGKISTNKESLSDELTMKAKSILGDAWQDGNRIKNYLNDLRRHVRGASFEYAWDNGLLSSIAAVVSKGDNWDKLLAFMQSKGMSDYRLAFAFYGMLNGFANLTRDFTDIVLNQEVPYLVEVYREFYGELHRVTIRVPETDSEPETEPSHMEVAEAKSQGALSDRDPSIFDRMLKFFDGLKIVAKNGVSKATLRNGLTLAMSELGENPDSEKLLTLLPKKFGNPYGWKKTNKPWKLMQAEFAPSCDSQVVGTPKKKNTRYAKRLGDSDSAGPLFDHAATVVDTNQQRRLLVEDTELLDILMRFFSNAKLEISTEMLHKDVSWIQSGYAVGGVYAQDPRKSPRDNLSTVRHFVNLLAKNGRIDDGCKELLKDYLRKYYK